MRPARYAISFAPFIAALAIGFAALHLWTSFLAFQRGNWQFGVFYLVFGIGGVAMAMALWRVRKRFDLLQKERQGPGGEGDR